MSKVERGETRLDIAQLRTVCRALGTSLPAFVTRLEERLPAAPPAAASRALNPRPGRGTTLEAGAIYRGASTGDPLAVGLLGLADDVRGIVAAAVAFHPGA